MTAEERAIMQAHVGYWANNLKNGHAIAVGPVADPTGSYGVGIIQLIDDDADPAELRDADPAMKANVGFRAEIYPMPTLLTNVAVRP